MRERPSSIIDRKTINVWYSLPWYFSELRYFWCLYHQEKMEFAVGTYIHEAMVLQPLAWQDSYLLVELLQQTQPRNPH